MRYVANLLHKVSYVIMERWRFLPCAFSDPLPFSSQHGQWQKQGDIDESKDKPRILEVDPLCERETTEEKLISDVHTLSLTLSQASSCEYLRIKGNETAEYLPRKIENCRDLDALRFVALLETKSAEEPIIKTAN